MFVWSVSTITEDICSFLPELYGSLVKIKGAAGTDAFTQTVNEEYEKAEPVSIDYGVMEKAENIYTIPGSFGWDDVGGWLALERINQVDGSGNYIKGNVVDLDTENSIVISDGSLTATVGISNIVVVVDGKNVLVCNKDNTQDIKKVVSILKERHMTKYL
jgi:mannose-1-phosphate guanylyltransferase